MNKVRDAVKKMTPYAWEESNEEIAGKYGLGLNEVIRFDMNTSPFILGAVKQAASNLSRTEFNEYPLPSYETLVNAVSSYAGVEASQLLVGAGADEVIDVIAKTFLDNGDASVVSMPTYSMFAVSTQSYGGRVVEVERKPPAYALDIESLVEASKQSKLLWVCNPNSPTGNASGEQEVKDLVGRADCTVVVDEAYSEFYGKSVAGLVNKFDNLVVARTLSKAFGLAGARVGYAVTNPSLATELNKVRPPCSISRASVPLAEAALSKQGIQEMKRAVEKIVCERKALAASLGKLGLQCFPSETNFLLVGFNGFDAGKAFEKLLEKGLVTRNFSKKKLTRNCLRITVRSGEENERLLQAIGEVVS